MDGSARSLLIGGRLRNPARCVARDRPGRHRHVRTVLRSQFARRERQLTERKPIRACEPSQNGLLPEPPQRHNRVDCVRSRGRIGDSNHRQIARAVAKLRKKHGLRGSGSGEIGSQSHRGSFERNRHMGSRSFLACWHLVSTQTGVTLVVPTARQPDSVWAARQCEPYFGQPGLSSLAARTTTCRIARLPEISRHAWPDPWARSPWHTPPCSTNRAHLAQKFRTLRDIS